MPSSFVEVKIPVPYGHIAGKAWGQKTSHSTNVLAIHGFKDNAGAFDRITPLLGDEYFVFAMDLPGHGYSSQLPEGIPYTDATWLVAVGQVLSYLELEKVTMFGHSIGFCIAVHYAALFPTTVDRIISFDTVAPVMWKPSEVPSEMAKSLKMFLKPLDKLTKEPIFTMDTAVKFFIVSHKIYGDLSEEAARRLLTRCTNPTLDGKGLTFVSDDRLNCTLSTIPYKADAQTLKMYYATLKCDIFIIRGSKGSIDMVNSDVHDILNLWREKCRSLKITDIDGGHYYLLNNPQVAARLVMDYLSTTKNENQLN